MFFLDFGEVQHYCSDGALLLAIYGTDRRRQAYPCLIVCLPFCLPVPVCLSDCLPAFFFRLPGGQTRQNAPTMKPHNRTRPFRDVRALVFFLLSASGRFDKKAVMLISNSEAEAMFEYSCNGFLCQLQRRHSCCICTMLHLTQNI